MHVKTICYVLEVDNMAERSYYNTYNTIRNMYNNMFVCFFKKKGKIKNIRFEIESVLFHCV